MLSGKDASHNRIALLFLISHIPLGVILTSSPALSTLHALATFAVGIFLAITKAPFDRLVYTCAYITGAEVMWRMTQSQIFYESGKYFVIFIALITFSRMGEKKMPLLPLLYFLFLLPAAIKTVFAVSAVEARELVSFNLSGPLALFVCALFFSHVRLSRKQLRIVLFMLVTSITSTASIATFSTVTASTIAWTTESNYTTSGGFGPNQVSSIFGLGILAVWILFTQMRSDRVSQLVFFGLGIWLLIQALLTFSRGGVVNAVIPIGVMVAIRVMKQEDWLKSLGILAIIAAVFILVLLPQLDSFTQGALGRRYAEINLTNRDLIAQADLRIFADNPFGVGVGLAQSYRESLLAIEASAHTEYTRLLAEHGILGLFSLGLLGLMAVASTLRNTKNNSGSGPELGFWAWSILFFFHAATRIVAPSFCIGLTFATLVDDNELPIT